MQRQLDLGLAFYEVERQKHAKTWWKSALRGGQISQVSNEVRENSRALLNYGSRKVV